MVQCSAVRSYVCAFNLVLLGVHALLEFNIFDSYFRGSYRWEDHSFLLKLGTGIQLLDIPHSLLGLTGTSIPACLIQVLGRMTMVYIIEGNPEVHSATTTLVLLFAWITIELFRYPYYALRAFDVDVFPVTWVRYSAWIPLYPLGLAMEATTMCRSIPFYYRSGVYGFTMPNPLNISFNMGVVLSVFVVTVFPTIAVFLLKHMKIQRAKKLAPSQKKKIN